MALREMELRRVPVSAVMTRGPATVEETAPLADAAAEMAAGGFRHLPVVDAAGRLVGMISERDLRARLGTELRVFTGATVDALAEPVAEVMTPGPRTIRPEALAVEVKAIGRAPISLMHVCGSGLRGSPGGMILFGWNFRPGFVPIVPAWTNLLGMLIMFMFVHKRSSP